MAVKKEVGNTVEKGGFKVRYIFFAVLVILFLLSLVSYTPMDAAALSGGSLRPAENWIGIAGAAVGFVSFHLFGLGAYFIAILLVSRMVRVMIPARPLRIWTPLSAAIMMIFGVLLLLALAPMPFAPITEKLGIGHANAPELALSGGVIGQWLAAPGIPEQEIPEGIIRLLIGAVGTLISSWALLVAGGILFFISEWAAVLRHLFFAENKSSASSRSRRYLNEEEEEDEEEEDDDPPVRVKSSSVIDRLLGRNKDASSGNEEEEEEEDEEMVPPPPPMPFAPKREEEEDEEEEILPPVEEKESVPAAANAPLRGNSLSIEIAEKGKKKHAPIFGGYELPSVNMLTKPEESEGEDQSAINCARDILNHTLESFDIQGKVTGHTTGPRVTRFEITLAPGINVKKVEQIAENIAMNLSATSVRVLAPIPGRPVVGVEVSNTKGESVFLRSVMESAAWQSGKAEIPIAIGKDVAGKPVVLDLAKAPHLLVAGATGTGKSVCTNTLIMSLLFNFTPDELKLIMVDPKIVEFEDYRELPHLLAPLINDSAKVPVALRWVANEMDRRYKVLAKVHVKKLSEFNRRPEDPEPVYDDDGVEIPRKLPYLVVVIDELADLMMTEAKKDVESNITRIAQKGRAAGIHIVVATQRPSTNIITGVIKANLPTRFCFQVRSGVDSRVVIDANGAEKLLGAGDMLLMSPSSMVIERIQGSWTPDDDIKQVVKFVCGQAKPVFNNAVLVDTTAEAVEEDDGFADDIDDFDAVETAPLIRKYMRPGDDDLMRKALEVAIIDRRMSTSYLQRRLKIGYNRAAELVDTLEERGVVGPPSGSGNKREILVFDGTDFADE